ncbi:MAG: Imm44 family immunity protein [Bacteroidota bacterium]
MKIAFAPVSTVEVKHVSLLSEFDNKLKNFFQAKNYGEDLKEIYIGVIVVSPRLERFFKAQKPTYTFKPTNYIRNTISCSLNKALNYRINLNFERFNNASEAEAREMLKKELLGSISLFDRFKNKIKDFNVSLFRQDLGLFFEEASA